MLSIQFDKVRMYCWKNPSKYKRESSEKLMLYNLWSVITRERLSPPSSFDCWYGTRRKRPGRFVRLFGFSLLYRNDSPVLVVNDSWFWRSTRLLSNPFSVFCFLGCCCLVVVFFYSHPLTSILSNFRLSILRQKNETKFREYRHKFNTHIKSE